MTRIIPIKTVFENEHLVFDLNSTKIIKLSDQTVSIFGDQIKRVNTFDEFVKFIESNRCDANGSIERSCSIPGDQVFNYSVEANARKIHLKEISWVNIQSGTFHTVFYGQDKKYFDLSYDALFEIVQKTVTPTILFNSSLTEVLSINSATIPILNEQVSELVSGFSIQDFFIEQNDFETVMAWIEECDSSMFSIDAKLLLGGSEGTWFHLNLYRVHPTDETLFLTILQDISSQKIAELKLQRSNELLTKVVEVQGHFLSKSEDSNPYELLLSNILKVIDAELGFVGKVLIGEDGKQMLKIHAATDISAHSKEAYNLYQKYIKDDYMFRHFESLFSTCIVEAKIILENNPLQNSHTNGTSVSGHTAISNFLGIPIMKGNEVIGLVGLGNKKGGFSDNDITELSPFVSTFSLIIEAIKFEKAKIQYENESKVKAEILSNVADHSPDLIVVMNKDSQFEFISPIALEFFEPGMEKKKIELTIRNILNQTILPEFKIDEGKYRSTLPLKYSNTEDLWVESSVNLLNEYNDKKVIAVIRDVSFQKAFETRLIKSLEKERQFKAFVSDFINVVSHEFKTPLATILSSMELSKYYLDRIGEEDILLKLKGHNKKVELELENLFELVNKSLDYDRFQANRPILKKEKVVFVEFIKNTLLSKQYFDKVDLICDIPDDFTTSIDFFLIETSISNLVSNALKYGSGSKRPKIHLFSSTYKYGVKVEDFGTGIPDNELPYIFTPFYRGSNTSGREGTGFGLVAVKNFIELHEGEKTRNRPSS